MSAIDIVLVAIALVAVGGCCGLRPAAQGPSCRVARAWRQRCAETLAALEQANSALDALNVALAETRRTASAIAQQQTTDAAVEQQRYLTIAREFSHRLATVWMTCAVRRPNSLAPTARASSTAWTRCARRSMPSWAPSAKDNNVQLDQMRATVDEKLSRTLNDRLSASFKQVSDQLEAVCKGPGRYAIYRHRRGRPQARAGQRQGRAAFWARCSLVQSWRTSLRPTSI